MTRTAVKICGITSETALTAASDAGATYIGLVFHPASPRAVTPARAAALAAAAPSTVITAGLFVDTPADEINAVLESVPLGMIQLHGNEPPEAVSALRTAAGLPVMKALRLGGPDDLDIVPAYEAVCDWLLFDTQSARGPGGTGETFDWSWLAGRAFARPWMLAGGLDAANIDAALSALTPDAVDVSSGVEDAPGVKSPQKIKDFIEAVQQNR